jgi:mannitol 2-dehydrogenase
MTEYHPLEQSVDSAGNVLAKTNFSFDRSQVQVGIVHIGAGRFHRAHEAVYCHELLEQGALQWGLSAAFILPSDKPAIDALRAQAGVYTLVERDLAGETPKVVGSIVEVLDGHNAPDALIARLSDPAVKVVTFTVTEAGYFFDPTTKALVLSHPAIDNDLNHPATPRSLYGFLAAGLAARRAAGLPPFTIQSCDNIQGNGDMMRQLFRTFLVARDAQLGEDLAEWVAENVSFPNSMVDRITPAAEPEELDQALKLFGCEDQMPVTAERYRQWVIEDDFCNGRPPWDSVGAQFVASVKPFERIKIRLLNAGHSAIAYAGYLASFETIGDIVRDPNLCAFLQRFFRQVEPTLPQVEGIDLAAYQVKLIERFANPAIVDHCLRICKDGSAKIPEFLLPTIRELLDRGLPTDSLAFVLASYLAFLTNVLEEQGSGAIDDPKREYLVELAQSAQGSMAVFLGGEALFGDLAKEEDFVAVSQGFYDCIQAEGIVKALPV